MRALLESIVQGLKLATTEPTAPVYICMDVDHQEQGCATRTVDSSALEALRALRPRAAPDAAAIDTIARWLIEADRPVVVADLVGRSEQAFDALVELAELLALPVIDPEGEYWKNSLNFPNAPPAQPLGCSRTARRRGCRARSRGA